MTVIRFFISTLGVLQNVSFFSYLVQLFICLVSLSPAEWWSTASTKGITMEQVLTQSAPSFPRTKCAYWTSSLMWVRQTSLLHPTPPPVFLALWHLQQFSWRSQLFAELPEWLRVGPFFTGNFVPFPLLVLVFRPDTDIHVKTASALYHPAFTSHPLRFVFL